MTKKQLSMIIGALILVNLITLSVFLVKNNNSLGSGKEAVATIGKDKVTKQVWLAELEERHGEAVLKELIDEKIVSQMAKKNGIEISDAELARELMMLKTLYHTNGGNKTDDEAWQEQLKLSLLLEELLTKDVIISEEEKKQYYEENRSRYMIAPSFHISHIVVETEAAGEQIQKELEKGATFSMLAMENSIDEFTANQGGEVGFISEMDDRFSAEYISTIKELEKGMWSDPVRVAEGYAIIQLHDEIEEKTYTFSEVEAQIRRQIAIEQMTMPISTQPFWDDLQVDWFYGSKDVKK